MDALDFLQQKEVKAFIQNNLQVDVKKLILNPPKAFKDQIKLLADQILARQKAKNKLPDWTENQDLIFPPPLSIEQASSEVTAQYKASIIKGKHLVDLTGGTGIDCLALSDQFEQTIYMEKEKWLCDIFTHNAEILKKDIKVVNTFSEDFLEKMDGKVTFFIDPARRDSVKNKVFKLEDCTPNLFDLMPHFRQKAEQVLVKLSPLIDLRSLIQEVEGIKEIRVVSVKNDCKEILLLLDFKYQTEPTIKAVNLESAHPDFSFKVSEEDAAASDFGDLEQYLYEPNASVLKAGAFKLAGQKAGLKKLGIHTHLYTSNSLVADFPGKVFDVIAPADKRNVGAHTANGAIHVITRNYPLSPEQLKKKFKVKDGGEFFLIGFRDWKEKAQLVIAKRVD